MTKDYRRNAAFQVKKQSNKLSVLNAILIFLLGYLSANLFDLNALNHFLQKPDVIHRSQVQKTASAARPKFEFYTLLANDDEARNIDRSANTKDTVGNNEKKVHKIPQPDFKPIEASIAKRLMTHSNVDIQVATEDKTQPIANKSSDYMVQLGAFKNQNDAQNLKGSLILKGFNAHVAMTEQQNMRLYRVLVGPFNSKEKAQSMQKALAASQRINGILINASLL